MENKTNYVQTINVTSLFHTRQGNQNSYNDVKSRNIESWLFNEI